MAALAQRGEVAWVIVARVLVQVCRGEDDTGRGQGQGDKAGQRRLQGGEPGRGGQCPRAPAAVVAPALPDLVPPQSIGADNNQLPVRPTAMLAAAAGAIEADYLAELAPVDRENQRWLGRIGITIL